MAVYPHYFSSMGPHGVDSELSLGHSYSYWLLAQESRKSPSDQKHDERASPSI